MKKLFINSAIIVVSFLVLDFIIGIFLRYSLENSPDGRFFKTQYTLEDAKEDIIIYGSSRAESNYCSKVFEDSLQMTCWNSGRGGQSLPYMYALNSAVTKRHTPKIAIINVEDIFLEYQGANNPYFDRAAGMLRPFYAEHPEIRNVVDHLSGAEYYLNRSNLYAYNSSYYYLLRPYAIEGLDGKLEDDGWKPKKGTLKPNGVQPREVNETNELNPDYKALFDEFVSSLTEKGTEVYVVTSPNYKEKVIHTATLEYIRSRNDITFLDYSNNTHFTENNAYFNDPNHMNNVGAMAFSADIARKIKSKTELLTLSE